MQTFIPAVKNCARLLSEKGLTICFAESATAGKLAYEFSQTDYAGEVFKGGVICYDACLKQDILSVPQHLIDKFSPESPEVTREMALRLGNIIKADLSVAVTGLTKPGGSETPEKPVGTMFYAVSYSGTVHERTLFSAGSPDVIIQLTIEDIALAIMQIV